MAVLVQMKLHQAHSSGTAAAAAAAVLVHAEGGGVGRGARFEQVLLWGSTFGLSGHHHPHLLETVAAAAAAAAAARTAGPDMHTSPAALGAVGQAVGVSLSLAAGTFV